MNNLAKLSNARMTPHRGEDWRTIKEAMVSSQNLIRPPSVPPEHRNTALRDDSRREEPRTQDKAALGHPPDPG